MARAFFLTLALLASLFVAVSRGKADERPDQVRVVYAPPKTAAHGQLRDELQQSRMLREIPEFLSPLRLPRRLTLRLEDCNGELNAWYEADVITICYDYLAFIKENAAKAPEPLGITPKAAFVGASLDLVLHEVGHAAFDMLKIPVFGREEDAADMFSAYIMLQFTPEDARKLIRATAYLSASEARRDQHPMPSLNDFASEHELPAQRYFNLLCMAYGSDPETFAGAVSIGKLPASRAKGCRHEYERIKYAFATLIMPHVDRDLLEKIRAKTWFDFDDDAPGR